MKCYGVAVVGVAVGMLLGTGEIFAASPYAGFTNGPPTDPNFFPIGVWYQNLQSNIISGYGLMGVNVYVYPDVMNSTALTWIKNAGMYTVIPQDSFGLSQVSNKTIIGWFNPPDEPDNAQSKPSGGYGDPVNPATVIAQYNTIKAADPTRPILLNLGQAVAWDAYYGRGSRSNHPQDYGYNSTYKWTNGVTYTGGYTAGSDIALFDFYPVNSPDAAVAGKINLVGGGVTRLLNWSPPGHPVWNWIETTDIQVGDGIPGPTPTQVKAEVWDSLIHGSTGIMYFAHSFPTSTHALLDDPVMNPAVTAINAQIKSLAPVLNSATVLAATITTGTTSNVHLDFMTKVLAGNEYLFSVADQNSNGTAKFKDPAMAGVNATVSVVGESRTLSMVNGAFADAFAANGVHLYEILGHTGFTPSLAAPLLLGDANLDGVVNIDDFGILSQNFGLPGGWSQANFLGDATVNINDFAMISQHFGQSLLSPSSVATAAELAAFQAASAQFFAANGIPEPASLVLLGLPAAAMLWRRRRGAGV